MKCSTRQRLLLALKRAQVPSPRSMPRAIRPTASIARRLNWALDPELWAQSEAGPDFEVSLSKLPDER